MCNFLSSFDKAVWTRAVLTAAMVCTLAASASAQIYSWRDENGVLTLSDRPRPGSGPATVKSYPVGTSDTVRTTVAGAAKANGRYDDLIQHHARQNGVRADLVRAVIQVESAFNPHAVSPKGAQGLMQLMPATALELGVTDAFNPAENIRGGVAYLRKLLDRYDNKEELALAAYNAGPGAVDKYGETIPPYRETQSYVSKIGKIAGAHHPLPGTRIYETSDVRPDGRVIPKYSDRRRD